LGSEPRDLAIRRRNERAFANARPSRSYVDPSPAVEKGALYMTATGGRVVIVLALIRKARKTAGHVIGLPLERARSIGQ